MIIKFYFKIYSNSFALPFPRNKKLFMIAVDFNFWTCWLIFMKRGMNIKPLEDTPAFYILISYSQ